jgi:transcriptional regulator with XRE-family HTH domain
LAEPTKWQLAVRRAFGDRVRTLRLEVGLSQEQLGLESGLDRSYVGQVERGERNLSLENIHRIAKALRTEPAELFRQARVRS